MIALLLVAAAMAAPELVVVGLHLPGQLPPDAAAAAERFAAALEASGKIDALAPAEVSRRIAGREALIVEAFAMGPGREKLAEGKVLYGRAQPDAAIPVLEDAARRLAAGLAVSSSVRELHDALTLLGMSHLGMGDVAAAKAAFRRSATLDPKRALDPYSFPPDAIAAFDQERAAIEALPKARLRATASMDATLWIDGRKVGATPTELDVVPGTHHVLVRATTGASWFSTIELAPGEARPVDATLAPRALGVAAADAPGRSRQTRELYRGVGEHVDGGVVVLAGAVSGTQVAVQLYDPKTGNFSRPLTAEAGAVPLDALLDLAPAVAGYLGETGIRPDRVSPQVVALDVGANDLLAGMLLDPPKDAPVTARRGLPWYAWAGIAAVAGGGAAAAVVVATASEEPEPAGGRVVFGPIP